MNWLKAVVKIVRACLSEPDEEGIRWIRTNEGSSVCRILRTPLYYTYSEREAEQSRWTHGVMYLTGGRPVYVITVLAVLNTLRGLVLSTTDWSR